MNNSDDEKRRLLDDENEFGESNMVSAGNSCATSQAVRSARNQESHDEPESYDEPNVTISNDASGYNDNLPIPNTPEYTGRCNFLCNPRSICHKGIALALMCSVGFGSYFCYDNPGALQVNKY